MDAIIDWLGSFRSKNRGRFSEEVRGLLQRDTESGAEPSIPPKEVTKVALRLKYQVEQVVSCEIEEEKITRANSPIITRKVVETARQAGGKEHGACVIYCLLVCKKWFTRQSILELWDSELHEARATACEVLAKRLIEAENDEEYMMRDTLLKRFSIYVNGEQTVPTNVIERAVDLHALLVIGSSGYQKTVNWLWRGWLVQDETNPLEFVSYPHKADTSYWVHFNPERMRTPRYQNSVQITTSLVYLLLYTIAINTINADGDIDLIEGILYIFTAGFMFDEIAKLWKVGRYYIGFWNVFNSTLYGLLTVSFVTRMIALGYDSDTDGRDDFNRLSYNFLAFSAPMFWMRLLLYLDTFRFFGAMLVVLKVMMKESLVFFVLLLVIGIGFLQAFLGLDNTLAAGHGGEDGDEETVVTSFIVQAMANALMQSPDFDGFERFSPPFGILLYYIFTFVIMVVLLNILIALFNSAYENVTDHSVDEYMALCASKTMQFVRAPDEHVFIPPFNLIELFGLVLPFEWWLPRQMYEKLCDTVMLVLYTPTLLVTAYLEKRQARQVQRARARGDADDDTVEEWEQLGMAGDPANADANSRSQEDVAVGEEWEKAVEATKPNVATDTAVLELRELKRQVAELKELLEKKS